MPLRFVTLIFATTLVLAGCATGPTERRSSSGQGVYETPGLSDSDNWVRQGVTDQQRARDTEDCYYAARALIAHDQAIESDRYAGRSQRITDDTRAFQQSLNRWEEQNRQVDLFNDCMEAKGYVRAAEE